MNNKILIFIPTYNESENVENLYSEIVSLNIKNIHFLFIDDNSPDGTGIIIDKIANENINVFTKHRLEKLGIGSAHSEAINWAYENNYETLITMDCDFTHSPSYISSLLKEGKRYDIVLASRFLKTDSLKDWNIYRKTMTYIGHFLTNYMLGIKYDATGAYRLYNLKNISKDIFSRIKSKGYSYFFESLFYFVQDKYLITEIPIELPSRTYGYSKMKISDMLHSLLFILKLFINRLFMR